MKSKLRLRGLPSVALRAERGTLRPYLGTVFIRTVTIQNLNPFNLMTTIDILVGNKVVGSYFFFCLAFNSVGAWSA